MIPASQKFGHNSTKYELAMTKPTETFRELMFSKLYQVTNYHKNSVKSEERRSLVCVEHYWVPCTLFVGVPYHTVPYTLSLFHCQINSAYIDDCEN